MNTKLSLFVLAILIFSLGWTTALFVADLDISGPEQSLTLSNMKNGNIERFSPRDLVSEDQIHVYGDRIVLDIENARWSKFIDTNSMDPLLDKGANGIELSVEKPTDLRTGDVISFDNPKSSGIVIHRIIDVGYDEQGWYAITKGDNNIKPDPAKVRFHQIKGVLAGVIY